MSPHRSQALVYLTDPCDFCHLRGIDYALYPFAHPLYLAAVVPQTGLSCRFIVGASRHRSGT